MPNVAANKKFIFNQSDKTYIFRQERSVNIFSTYNLSKNEFLEEIFLQEVKNENIRKLLIPEIIRALLQENLFSHACCEPLKKRYTEIKENSKSANFEESKILKESIKILIDRIEKICMNNDEIIKAYIHTVICEKHIFLSDIPLWIIAQAKEFNKIYTVWRSNEEKTITPLSLIYPQQENLNIHSTHLLYLENKKCFYSLTLVRTIQYRYQIKKESVIIRLWKPRPIDPEKYYGHISLEIPSRAIYASFCPNLQQSINNGILVTSFIEDKNKLNNREPDEIVILKDLSVNNIVKKYNETRKRITVEWNVYSSIRSFDFLQGEGYQATIGGAANCAILVRILLEAGGMDSFLGFFRASEKISGRLAPGRTAFGFISITFSLIYQKTGEDVKNSLFLHWIYELINLASIFCHTLSLECEKKEIVLAMVSILAGMVVILFSLRFESGPVTASVIRGLSGYGIVTTPQGVMNISKNLKKNESSLSEFKKREIWCSILLQDKESKKNDYSRALKYYPLILLFIPVMNYYLIHKDENYIDRFLGYSLLSSIYGTTFYVAIDSAIAAFKEAFKHYKLVEVNNNPPSLTNSFKSRLDL